MSLGTWGHLPPGPPPACPTAMGHIAQPHHRRFSFCVKGWMGAIEDPQCQGQAWWGCRDLLKRGHVDVRHQIWGICDTLKFGSQHSGKPSC